MSKSKLDRSESNWRSAPTMTDSDSLHEGEADHPEFPTENSDYVQVKDGLSDDMEPGRPRARAASRDAFFFALGFVSCGMTLGLFLTVFPATVCQNRLYAQQKADDAASLPVVQTTLTVRGCHADGTPTRETMVSEADRPCGGKPSAVAQNYIFGGEKLEENIPHRVREDQKTMNVADKTRTVSSTADPTRCTDATPESSAAVIAANGMGSERQDSDVVDVDVKVPPKGQSVVSTGRRIQTAEIVNGIHSVPGGADIARLPINLLASGEEQFRHGMVLRKQCKPDDAVKALQAAVAQGHGEAMYQLGMMYWTYLGNGVAEDRAKARELFQRAADAQHAGGWAGLGLLMLRGQGGAPYDPAQGVKLLEQAMASGHAGGFFGLGIAHYYGIGVPRDHARAAALYQLGAELQHMYAMNRLGLLYYDGEGVTKDRAQAAQWYQRAAEMGHAHSMHMLGRMFRDGEGVTKDGAKARLWLKRGAAMKHQNATYTLKNL